MAYGKVLHKIKERGETCTLQVNGRYYEMSDSTRTGRASRHRLYIPCTSPARLQAHWEGFWQTFMENVHTNRQLEQVIR